MKKMKFLVSQLYMLALLALLALPFISSSCSDDDDDPKVEITSLGIENGATVNAGQAVELKAQINNNHGTTSYSWVINGKEVSTENIYTFQSDTVKTYTIQLTVNNEYDTVKKEINITVTYPASFYVINEGKEYSSINQYKEGKWNKKIIEDLGLTATIGVIYENYMYIVSKGSPNLTKMNMDNFSNASQIDNIDGQGYNICIINQETAVMTTSKGAYKVKLNPLTVEDKLLNTSNSKDIYKIKEQLFILDGNTIKVYNINDFSFKKDLTHQANAGFAQAKDGSLWAANGNKLVKIDTNKLESEEIQLPNDLNIFFDKFAYRPSGLCASTTENALYFAHAPNFSGTDIYKFDITTQNVNKFFTAPTNYSGYGAGIQVNPQNGDVYLIYTEDGWGAHYLNTYIYVVDGVTGTQKAIIDYTGEYWFPSTITFQ